MQIYEIITKPIRYILSYLYHGECVFCADETELWHYICDDCKNKISEKEYTAITPNGFLCLSAFEYREQFKNSVLRFKFGGHREYSRTYASIVFDKYRDRLEHFNPDFITSVPLSEKSFKKRGYNQAELLAKDIAFFCKKPYNKVLSKIRDNEIQHDLNKELRKQNVKNVYEVISDTEISGKRIIICDDIITTGWTLNECAESLKAAGADDVLCITAAKTPLPH